VQDAGPFHGRAGRSLLRAACLSAQYLAAWMMVRGAGGGSCSAKRCTTQRAGGRKGTPTSSALLSVVRPFHFPSAAGVIRRLARWGRPWPTAAPACVDVVRIFVGDVDAWWVELLPYVPYPAYLLPALAALALSFKLRWPVADRFDGDSAAGADGDHGAGGRPRRRGAPGRVRHDDLQRQRPMRWRASG